MNVVGGLLICAVLGLASGWALNYFGVCPLVKRIWTPSWTLLSTGWCWLMLAGFYAVIDGLGFRVWSFPLIVAGMNSILLYLMGQLLPGWTKETLRAVLRLRRVHVLPGRPGEVRASHSLQPGAAVLLAVCVLAVSAEDFCGM